MNRPALKQLSIAAALALGLVAPAAWGATDDAIARADSLQRRALARLVDDSIESRQAALKDLEAALLLAPKRIEILRELARLSRQMGNEQRSRSCWERIVALAPDDGAARSALGLAWKWEWLATVQDSAYARAVRTLVQAASLAPRDLECRLALAGLALAKMNFKLASIAAQSARACDRHAPEALLAYACAQYWGGDLAMAAAAFDDAVPRLPAAARQRFSNLGVIGERAASTPDSASAGDAVAAAFWQGQDADLTTNENEVELDFLTRTATVLLLFRDGDEVRWDVRAELFLRYGAPEAILPPPPNRDLSFHVERLAEVEGGMKGYAPPPLEFPYHMQTWSYPGLGIAVELWDRSLGRKFEIPHNDEPGSDPRPNPKLLAGRGDLVALGDGLGVYRTFPPGISLLPTRAALMHFPEGQGSRLVAYLEAPGGPTDSLWGRWVVIDSNGRPVQRGEGEMSISACDPTERRVAQFTASLPPGDYKVDLSVSGRSRRGVVHLNERVASSPESLAMSELVLLCGPPAVLASQGSVRIEPNLEQRLSGGREVSVYFELDGLATGEDGQAAFSYAYSIRPVKPSRKARREGEGLVEASREETNVGRHRRQFVSAPVGSLAKGDYDLEIQVRDLRSGATATRSLRFTKG